MSDTKVNMYMARLNPLRYGLGPLSDVHEVPQWSDLPAKDQIEADKLAESLRYCKVQVEFPLDDAKNVIFHDTITWDLLSPKAQTPIEFAVKNGRNFGISNDEIAKLAGSVAAQIDRHLEQVPKLGAQKQVKKKAKKTGPTTPRTRALQGAESDNINGKTITREEIDAYIERKREELAHLKMPAEYWSNASCHICHNRKPHGFNNCHLKLNKHTYCVPHIQQRFGVSFADLRKNPELWNECPACFSTCICSACTAQLLKEVSRDQSKNPQFYPSVAQSEADDAQVAEQSVKTEDSNSVCLERKHDNEFKNDSDVDKEKRIAAGSSSKTKSNRHLDKLYGRTQEKNGKNIASSRNGKSNLSNKKKTKKDKELVQSDDVALTSSDDAPLASKVMPQGEWLDENIPYCISCNDDSDDGLVMCNRCPRTFHSHCVSSGPVVHYVHGQWTCDDCRGASEGCIQPPSHKGNDHIAACESIIRFLLKSNISDNFRLPVSLKSFGGVASEWERYCREIPLKYHMDLGSMKQKLKNGMYGEKDDGGRLMMNFVRDIRQIWLNCWLFNGYGSTLYRIASIFSDCTEKWLQETLIPIVILQYKGKIDELPSHPNCPWHILPSISGGSSMKSGKRERKKVPVNNKDVIYHYGSTDSSDMDVDEQALMHNGDGVESEY